MEFTAREWFHAGHAVMTESDEMPREPDYGRRRFPGQVAMTLAAMRFGLLGDIRGE